MGDRPARLVNMFINKAPTNILRQIEICSFLSQTIFTRTYTTELITTNAYMCSIITTEIFELKEYLRGFAVV